MTSVLVVLGIGIILFGLGFWLLLRFVSTYRKSDKAKGLITSVSKGNVGTIDFEYHGKPHTIKTSYSASWLKTGQKLTVLIPPGQPEAGTTFAQYYILFSILFLFGFFLILPSAYFIQENLAYKAAEEFFLNPQNGKKISLPILTTFHGTTTNTSGSTINYYVIIAKQTDAEKERTRWFVSQKLWSDPEPYLPNKDSINVFVSKTSDVYAVDLSFLDSSFTETNFMVSESSDDEDHGPMAVFYSLLPCFIGVAVLYLAYRMFTGRIKGKNADTKGGSIGIGCIGVAFIYVGIGATIGLFQDEAEESELLSSGVEISADLDELELSSIDIATDDATVNYKLHCSWKNPRNGKVIHFTSHPFPGTSASHYGKNKIRVLIDSNNPEKESYVDLEPLTNERKGIWLKY
jgi:hypothetical protein